MRIRSSVFLKHGRRGKPHLRKLVVTGSPDGRQLVLNWSTGKMLVRHGSAQVLVGKRTKVLARSQQGHAKCCFSVVHDTRTLDLQANTKAERDHWVAGLHLSIEALVP